MSFRSTPAPAIAAITRRISAEFAASAAEAVRPCVTTPKWNDASSGTVSTVPVPVTSTPRAGRSVHPALGRRAAGPAQETTAQTAQARATQIPADGTGSATCAIQAAPPADGCVAITDATRADDNASPPTAFLPGGQMATIAFGES